MSAVTPEPSYSGALTSARAARRAFIELTYQIPEGARRDVYVAWHAMDAAMVCFIRALERETCG